MVVGVGGVEPLHGLPSPLFYRIHIQISLSEMSKMTVGSLLAFLKREGEEKKTLFTALKGSRAGITAEPPSLLFPVQAAG